VVLVRAARDGKSVEIEPLFGAPDYKAPDPNFTVRAVSNGELVLQKLSSSQEVSVPLHAVSVPWGRPGALRAEILSGRLMFFVDVMRWRWAP